MSKQKSSVRIAKLRELINDYRYHYHILNESIMSESAADSLKHELTQLETEYPDLITPDSPTQRIAGAPLPGFRSVAHSTRMLSLNDVFDEEEIQAWIDRITKLAPADKTLEYFMDIKMDGLACALRYEDGILKNGITRGDGLVGEDVTANVRTIESVPLRLHTTKEFALFLRGRTEIRGEIVMYKNDFAMLNAERESQGLPLFANPRNTAAGTIRQLDPKLVAVRPLQFHAYDLLRENNEEVPTNAFAYNALRGIGLLANKEIQLTRNAKGIIEFANFWETKRHDLAFNTDGLVVKVNDKRLFAAMGVVGKAPRAAIAFKYPAEQSTTKVKDIFVSIGRTGSATPVAILDPVVVAGSTVQMATLHNESEVLRKDIRVGDTVIIHKAGDIIPEVVESLKKLRDGSEKPFMMPDTCPECDTKLVKLKAIDAIWRCPNNSCPSRVQKRIQHFASKSALDIEGLGEKNVIALLQSSLIKDAADIYNLKVEHLLKLDRFAEVSANKLVTAIQAKTNPPLSRFMYGLGIRHVGAQIAVDLARHFRRLDSLGTATYEDLKNVEGVGEIVAESILAWFSDTDNQTLLANFRQQGVWPQDMKQIGGKLMGKKFVVTGGLETMAREQAAEKIRALGGTFQASIAKDTDYLVVGTNVGANKLAKAERLGTTRITETELVDLLTK